MFSKIYSTIVTAVCVCRYFTERGDAVAKASKDTHVVRKTAAHCVVMFTVSLITHVNEPVLRARLQMDYRSLVHEKDEAAYCEIRVILLDIRGYYVCTPLLY